jgi:hypothetical protein
MKVCELPGERIGPSRSLLLTGIPVSAREMWEAVRPRAKGQVMFQPDARIQEIMDAVPKATLSARAAQLGLRHSASIEEIVDEYQKTHSDPALARHG